MKGNVLAMWNVPLFYLFKKNYFELYEIDSRSIEKKIKQNLQQSINIDGIKTCVSRKCIARIQTSNIFYFNY